MQVEGGSLGCQVTRRAGRATIECRPAGALKGRYGTFLTDRSITVARYRSSRTAQVVFTAKHRGGYRVCGRSSRADAGRRELPVKLALLGVIACCAVVFAAAQGDGEKRAPAAARARRSPGPARPAPCTPGGPSRYRVPRGAIHVSTAAELQNALRHRSRSAIVLANGTYSSRRPFINSSATSSTRPRLGRAVLRAGLSLGGNEGDGGGARPRPRGRRERSPPHRRRRRYRGLGYRARTRASSTPGSMATPR